MKHIILCDLDIPYDVTKPHQNYKCSRINSDDWDELEDPCDGCSHRCYKEIDY